MRTVAVVGDDKELVRSLADAAANAPETEGRAEQSTNGELDRVLASHPDVLVVDEHAWARTVSPFTRHLEDDTHVVVVVSDIGPAAVFALTSGASGVLIESTAAELLPHVLDVVAEGLYVMPKAVLELLLTKETQLDAASGVSRIERLTPREREVLSHLMAGEGHREIAESLLLSVHTVRFHMKHILAKLAVNSGLEAAMLGARAGVLPERGRSAHRPPSAC